MLLKSSILKFFDYLCFQHRSELVLSRSVLELGSGVGLVATVAALCGARHVHATDLELALPLLIKNVEKNLSSHLVEKVKVSTFDVTSPKKSVDNYESVDLVVGADLVYDFELTDGIVETLKMLIVQQKEVEKKTILFTLEKRYIFTVKNLDTVAPAFDYFVTQLEDLKSDLLLNWKLILNIEPVPLHQICQSFCYERTKDLTLLKLSISSRGEQ